MQQSRLESLLETIINTTIGYVIAIASQLLLFPIFGIHIPLSSNLLIGAWFTAISIVRGYVIRRWFNSRLKRLTQDLASKFNKDKDEI